MFVFEHHTSQRVAPPAAHSKQKGRKMDYREQAKDLLSRKKGLTSAYSGIIEELELLEEQKLACKTAAVNSQPQTAELYEDRLISILAELEDCRFRLSIVKHELLKIEKGLNGLSDYYRDIIETFFIEEADYAADELMERWYKERSSLYRDRTRALDKFTRCVYGVLQL